MRGPSSTSRVRRWPSPEVVHAAAQAWASALAASDSGVVAVGYFGSFARGDSGFGSDLDLVVIREERGPDRLADSRGTESLPVPADVLSFTTASWSELMASERRMAETLRRETVWVLGSGATLEADEPNAQ